MSLYITGDTHGDIDFHKLNTKNFPEGNNLTKEDYILICGDAGIVWDNNKFDKYIQRWYNSKPWTTLFVDGNHENHDALNSYPITEWNNGKVHMISDSIIHLMRGQIYNIDGCNIFTFGGASSHDKEYRKEGISWWPQEMPTQEEYDNALNNFAKYDREISLIVSHCAPTKIQKQIAYWYENDFATNALQSISETFNYAHWYFGHYHIDKQIDEKHTAIYNKIIKVL